jgi:hypothetical protein
MNKIIIIIILFLILLLSFIFIFKNNKNKQKDIIKENDIKQNDIKQNDIKQNDIKQNDIKQNIIKQNIIKENTKIINNTDKPNLFLYWEGIMPAYIDMCKQTIYKHASESFNIIFLNDKNIDEYLPELKENKLDFSRLKIAQKVDYYRILLLYKYGGLYMDIDILCMRNPIEIMMKLNDEIDFVGFGCTGNICKYGYGKPSNGIMASKPNTELMKNILRHYEMKLKEINDKDINNNDINYFEFGKFIIWQELDVLIKNHNYKYFHYPNTFD